MTYLSTFGPAAKLRLYHEVTVARADEQFFEYTNCHTIEPGCCARADAALALRVPYIDGTRVVPVSPALVVVPWERPRYRPVRARRTD